MTLFDGFEHIVRDNEPLAAYTWLRLGGPAQYFGEPTTVDELSALVRRCAEQQLPVRLLGGGSNVLVRDEGVPGLVLHLAAPEFSVIRVAEDRLNAGGGAKLGHVVSTAVREGLAGIENLVGIPGSVGGALHGNAGTHGGDVGQWVASATVMTRSGEMVTRSKDEMRFAYRASSLDELVILDAQLKLEQEDPVELTKRMQKQWIVRKAGQPSRDLPTGYIFKDPAGASAAQLIEQAGLRGTRVGEAEIYDPNANFIVAAPGSTSSDVIRLIDLIRSSVQERLGVELEMEIEIW